ncbi:LOW QUALITY PROTEIN: hypothetical protein PHMEG_00017272 [Phytophthora megakarya]|uniref:Tyr recombinase domain-containing protein n=1 Tax=Phytophthora megakarya TaxID=4795 RepID=A0A225VYG7_9STRA|nr:LOW QUALITY PROTEIN: hypothetical protein PHMEG_00017272 [Phytophthora megakarya]
MTGNHHCASTPLLDDSCSQSPAPLKRQVPSVNDLRQVTDNGVRRLTMWNNIQVAAITAAFRRAGVTFPAILPLDPHKPASDIHQLNKPLQAAMSDYVRRTKPSLKAFVELLRGQTASDYRPNKALLPAVLMRECMGYPRLDDLIHIASEGVRVNLTSPLPSQTRFSNNHPSASTRINVLRKNIRKEQDSLRCIVVDADLIAIWPEIYVIPFGVVDKGDCDPRFSGRVIHDLSFPEGSSVNHRTDHSDIAKPTYEHCSSIAREITRCQRAHPSTDVKVMAGDVAAAYRNACIHSDCVHMFAGHIPEDNAIVIDMSAAFGWSGSAGTYGVLGGAVAFIHGNHTDATHDAGFFSYHWVDDHINVAPDVGSHCSNVDRSLRYAMTTVMGPGAVNEEKFTPWSTQQKVLGLVFDTSTHTVAMPASKIAKAQRIVEDAIRSHSLTRIAYRSLLGSLRHVATCIRPARAFLQRLRAGEPQLRRRSRIYLTAAMRDDLVWWRIILQEQHLNGVPLVFFEALPQPDITVITDASDVGLCALVSSRRLALTYQFQPRDRKLIDEFKAGETNEFDINYRELLACAFAIHAWGETWQSEGAQERPTHVHFRVDNTTAISWQSKLASRNSRAQLLIRLLSIWEQRYGLRLSSSHIPGVENTTADTGSRRWQNTAYSTMFDAVTLGLALHLREHSVAESSFKAYERAFRYWKGWTLAHDVPWHLNLPVDKKLRIISDFVIDGAQNGFGSHGPVSSSTIKATLLGVRHFFVAAGYDFPANHPQIRMLIKGVRRFDPPRQQKAPVSIALLERCANSLSFDDPADQALWGVLCLAFFFLLRHHCYDEDNILLVRFNADDIAIIDASGSPTDVPSSASATCIRLRGSKTNQAGTPLTRMLRRSGHPVLCPVLGALLLRRAHGPLPAQMPAAVYVGTYGKPGCVSSERVARAIKSAAREAGEDPSRYSTHSLRSGGATCMYRSGVDALTIQFHGRCLSDAFKLYTRLCRESVTSVASRMVSGEGESTTLA